MKLGRMRAVYDSWVTSRRQAGACGATGAAMTTGRLKDQALTVVASTFWAVFDGFIEKLS